MRSEAEEEEVRYEISEDVKREFEEETPLVLRAARSYGACLAGSMLLRDLTFTPNARAVLDYEAATGGATVQRTAFAGLLAQPDTPDVLVDSGTPGLSIRACLRRPTSPWIVVALYLVSVRNIDFQVRGPDGFLVALTPANYAASISSDIFLQRSSSVVHVNVVLIDLRERSFERFDPYGFLALLPDEDLRVYRVLTQEYPVLGGFLYYPPEMLCPHGGPQAYQERTGYTPLPIEGGYCGTWALLYLVSRLAYPDVSRNEIVAALIAGGPPAIHDRVHRAYEALEAGGLPEPVTPAPPLDAPPQLSEREMGGFLRERLGSLVHLRRPRWLPPEYPDYSGAYVLWYKSGWLQRLFPTTPVPGRPGAPAIENLPWENIAGRVCPATTLRSLDVVVRWWSGQVDEANRESTLLTPAEQDCVRAYADRLEIRGLRDIVDESECGTS